MGLGHKFKRAVKHVTKAVKSIAKATVKFGTNPVKYLKENKLMGLSPGLPELFYNEHNVNAASEITSAETKGDELSQSQQRSRMISRQGMQGNIPTMLLGQDYVPSDLAEDEELGGKEK